MTHTAGHKSHPKTRSECSFLHSLVGSAHKSPQTGSRGARLSFLTVISRRNKVGDLRSDRTGWQHVKVAFCTISWSLWCSQDGIREEGGKSKSRERNDTSASLPLACYNLQVSMRCDITNKHPKTQKKKKKVFSSSHPSVVRHAVNTTHHDLTLLLNS